MSWRLANLVTRQAKEKGLAITFNAVSGKISFAQTGSRAGGGKQKTRYLPTSRSLIWKDAPFFIHIQRSRPYLVAGVGVGPTTQGL